MHHRPLQYAGCVEPGGRSPAPEPLRLVQAFVNTNDIEGGRDQFDQAWGLAGWLADRGLLPAGEELSEREHRTAVDVREAIRSLLRANAGAGLDPAGPTVLTERPPKRDCASRSQRRGAASSARTREGSKARSRRFSPWSTRRWRTGRGLGSRRASTIHASGRSGTPRRIGRAAGARWRSAEAA